MKKLIALVLALAMVLTMVSAFADTNNLTLDGSISVAGLETGDKVDFYKVLEWNNGWVSTSDFALTAEQVTEIAGVPAKPATPAVGDPSDTENYKPAQNAVAAVSGSIDWDMAKLLAQKSASITPKYANVEESSGTATVTGPEAGLYLVIIKTTKSGVVYNPAFVAADFGVSNPETSAIDVSVLSYSADAVAKKSTITLDKTMTGQTHNNDSNVQTTNVGDVVSFKIETKIPIFTADYTNPVFKVQDIVSAGLDIASNIGSVTLAKPTGARFGTDYTMEPIMSDDTGDCIGFEVSFDGDYLKGLGAITDVEITYSATVTNAAVNNINVDDNTVDLIYSTNPSDTSGAGRLRDKTKEYTFSLDADILGSESYDITELVKVGLKQDGTEITETRTLDNGYSVGALQGATFGLFKDEACTTRYTNQFYTATSTLSSDVDGRINIKGLDGGVYYIKELTAPNGYIKDQKAHKIEIKTSFSDHTYNETVDGIDVTYKVRELDSYTVEVDGVQTASFSFEMNEGKYTHTDITGRNPDDGKIKNVRGTELPSTGGIGTTIFYILGGLLVVGAAVILVARRKAHD